MRRTLLIALLVALALLAGVGAWLLAGGSTARIDRAVIGADAVADVAELPQIVGGEASTPEALGQLVLADAESGSPKVPAPSTQEANLPPACSFRGRVVDDRGLPLAGATVVWWPNELSSPLYGLSNSLRSDRSAIDALPRALTGSDGRFDVQGRFVEGLGPGWGAEDPQIVAIADGYAIRTHVCLLYSGGDIDIGDIALEPAGWIEGRVVDAHGQPIAGASIRPRNPWSKARKVSVSPEDSIDLLTGVFAAALSQADGRFRTGGLWQGKVQIGISAEGYLDRFNDYQPVTAGGGTDLGDVVLDSGASISGQVHDTGGAALAGARIVALSSGSVRSAWRDPEPDLIVTLLQVAADRDSVPSDVEGRFTVPGLGAVNHSVLVTAAGYEPARVDDVLPGGGEIGVVLDRAATLRLLVTSSVTGQPVTGTEVEALRFSSLSFNPSSIELAAMAGDAPGGFVVSGLGRVCTRVIVRAPGHASQTLTLDGVAPPTQVERAVALVPEAVLAGRVIGDDGRPLPAADLVLRWTKPDVEEDVAPIHPDVNGRFEFRGLAAGEWSLVADAPDRSPVARSEMLGEGEARTDVDFVLPRAAEVFGTCTTADGTPNVGSYQHFERLTSDGIGREERDVRCNAEGRYALRDVPIGRWKVYFGEPMVEFDLVPGQRLQLDMRSEAGARLEGRVLKVDGTPVADAWVFVVLLDDSDHFGYLDTYPFRTDESGHWSWENARVGALQMTASVPGGGGASASVPIDLVRGERRSVDLVLGEGRVAGIVVEKDGQPVAGAKVYVTPVTAGGEDLTYWNFGKGNEEFDFGFVTDVAGHFEMDHLAAGRYRPHVSVKGARGEKHPPFDLTAGAPVDLQLKVIRTGRISGTVRLPSGVPFHEGQYVHAEGPDQNSTARIGAGNFLLEGLQPGIWRLSISEHDKVLVERIVVVESGKEQIADLVVTP